MLTTFDNSLMHIFLLVPLLMLLGFGVGRKYERYVCYVVLFLVLYMVGRLYVDLYNGFRIWNPVFYLVVVCPMLYLVSVGKFEDDWRWMFLFLGFVSLVYHISALMN